MAVPVTAGPVRADKPQNHKDTKIFYLLFVSLWFYEVIYGDRVNHAGDLLVGL
jgi:hypothetical protein